MTELNGIEASIKGRYVPASSVTTPAVFVRRIAHRQHTFNTAVLVLGAHAHNSGARGTGMIRWVLMGVAAATTLLLLGLPTRAAPSDAGPDPHAGVRGIVLRLMGADKGQGRYGWFHESRRSV